MALGDEYALRQAGRIKGTSTHSKTFSRAGPRGNALGSIDALWEMQTSGQIRTLHNAGVRRPIVQPQGGQWPRRGGAAERLAISSLQDRRRTLIREGRLRWR